MIKVQKHVARDSDEAKVTRGHKKRDHLTSFFHGVCVWLLFGAGCAVANESELPNWHMVDGGKTVLKGDFQQTKHNKHLRRPLKSNGTIVLSMEAGIAWQTVFPVKSTLVITKTTITNINSKGQRKQVGGGGELNLVFLNALVGNWTLLKQHFSLDSRVTEQQHCVDLQPKTSLLQQNIAQISVCGSKDKIATMTIKELNGSTTETAMDLNPYATLTSEEQLLFND